MVPGIPQAVADARRFLLATLHEHGLTGDLADTAALLVSEIVTNAVLHARTDVLLRCTVEGSGVLVEVADGSTLLPRPREHDAEAVTGRGLELVELLADAHGVRRSGAGKSVWFTLAGATPPTGGEWHPPVGVDGTWILLPDVPVGLYEVLQEHNEALLREYQLSRLALDEDEDARKDIADAAHVRVRLATAFRTAVAAAGERPARVHVPLSVAPAEIPAFELLPNVLDSAEAAAAAGRLLTRPALPELLALRNWLYAQIVHQVRGGEPTSWSPTTARLDPPLTPPAPGDIAWVRETAHAVVVADDANRVLAVSSAAAALVGWAVEDLLGQRVTALVPERLREAHVTGFTRQLVTGRRALLDDEVTVPALTQQGQERLVRLRLERQDLAGRTIYLGWLGLP